MENVIDFVLTALPPFQYWKGNAFERLYKSPTALISLALKTIIKEKFIQKVCEQTSSK